MNISLPAQLELLVKKKVKSGMYASASEVIREALRMMEQIEEMKSEYLQKKMKNPLISPYTQAQIELISSHLPTANFYSQDDPEIDSPSFNNTSHNMTRKELWENIAA